MRLRELNIDEVAYTRSKLKEMHPHLTEKQLDEIAPLAALAPMAAGAARVGAAGAKVAGKVGVQAAKMGAQAAKMGAKVAGQAGKAVAKGAGKAVAGAGKQVAGAVATGVANKINTMAANKLLKPGSTLPIAGSDMKIDAVKGNEITIADPKNNKAPKVVLQKDSPEVKSGLQTLTQRVL